MYGLLTHGPESSRRRRSIDGPPRRAGDLMMWCGVHMEDVLGCHKVRQEPRLIATPRAVDGPSGVAYVSWMVG